MRYEFMLAIRYLRSRREERFVSLVGWSSGIGVAIGVAALIVVLSVMYGFDTELKDRILGFSSHVDIQGPGERIADWRTWLVQAGKLPGVVQAAPYVASQVLAAVGTQAVGAILKGVDFSRERQLAAHIVQGRYPHASDDDIFQIVMGKDLARKLGVQVGDRIRLLSPASGIGPGGIAPRMRAFRLAGIFDSGFYEYDIGLIMAPLAAVQRLNRMGDSISGIALHLADRDQARAVAEVARHMFPPGTWVIDWMQRHRSFFHALRMERVVMGVILSLIVLVAVFNMVSSLVMVVMERRKEIAILKTVGATRGSIMGVFLSMGALLTGAGTGLGAFFGLLLASELDTMLAWVERVTGITILSGDVYYIDHVPSIIDPVSVSIVIITSFCMGMAATFYPAWRAAGIPPADALRYE